MALGKNEIHRRFGQQAPADEQLSDSVSENFTSLAESLDDLLPDGPMKMNALQQLEVSYLLAQRAAAHG